MALAGAAPTELGTEKIGKLLKMYAVPGIIAQTAASLYNMVDSIYIGHIKDVGSYAISGLAVTFPLMNLSAALGTLVGVGAMTLISVLLGQKNYSTAAKVLSNVLTLNVVISILFTAVTLLFLDPILYFFGASDNTIPFARKYMTIILLGNVITHLYFGFNGIIRSAGNPKLAMNLTLFTVVSNAILDPIFIFVLDLGIQGAALATVLCQTMALSYSMRYLSRKDNFLHFPRPLFQLDWRIAKQSLAIGIGPFLMNSASCLVAIAGYNYGARQYSRVKEIFILTAKWEVLVTTVCFLVSELIPEQAVSLFTNDPELIRFSAHGLRVMNVAFALVGFGMVSGNFFQCLGMVRKSIFLSLTRQLIFLLPLVYTLPIWFEEKGVWMSFPISDALNILISAILIIDIFRKFNKLNDGDDPSTLGSTIS